ncbi:RagB/SusD family nutrient uptake outer membrane protein [Parapedobacter sp. 10938]|uniref:RagB/SusD family nutrient uptake outer membrane protein n=1 Tax=Parapedobacter flavus TaxID=3110225 RepID=UPI002DB85634|nr:RagB/SusD family nutrient uptake outer membrane protein [Parapedobacter sp. 10938]MEC3881066.1 RagB/SusD family nutrient uptake outer membrane protein [Parapedobacter sp. 10938]
MNTIYKNIGFTVLIVLFGLLESCEILEPEASNIHTMEDLQETVTHAEGILLAAYNNLTVAHNNFPLAYGSDDAVTNDPAHTVKQVVAGGWTANTNPFGSWNTSYQSILYLNTFLENMDEVEWWWKDRKIDSLYAKRLTGEAYGLRAWYYFDLLQAHAGRGTNGQLLGVPIVDHVLDASNPDDYQIPRASFNELVDFIISDCDRAIANLPARYANSGEYSYDEAMGEQYTNRINGLAVRLIKTKTLLYAASPAYTDGTYTYEHVAEEAAAIMDLNGGLSQVNFDNHSHIRFYNNQNVATSNAHPEVFWYSARTNGNNWEANNYPPSLYGSGRTNPTQDLVDAFPMLDGTPVTAVKRNSTNPYSGRDPRLSLYILYNGATISRSGATITMNIREGSQDAGGGSDRNATLTGYYLRKFMNVSEVNLNPAVNSQGTRYYTYARYTDVLLMFAEAANQIAGPHEQLHGYSANQVINAIRDRAGITTTAYVDGLNQNEMEALIKNERRLEMCFENQRFWDLRRWMMVDDIKQPVSGVHVSPDGTTYSYVEVEDRNYHNYQLYGPIPFAETLKYDMVQNEGW